MGAGFSAITATDTLRAVRRPIDRDVQLTNPLAFAAGDAFLRVDPKAVEGDGVEEPIDCP